jgi:hypothetical protein
MESANLPTCQRTDKLPFSGVRLSSFPGTLHNKLIENPGNYRIARRERSDRQLNPTERMGRTQTRPEECELDGRLAQRAQSSLLLFTQVVHDVGGFVLFWENTRITSFYVMDKLWLIN